MAEETVTPKKKSLWVRLVKWLGVAIGVVIALFILLCSLIVWILTPERLTPLVEKYGSEYLEADVRASRIELTFWKSFPRLRVDVDSLQLISRSLASLPAPEKAQLPADADSLLYIRHFHGGVNAVKLLAGKIKLHDVTFEHPRVNLLQVNDSVTNYLIVKESEDKEESTSGEIPEIEIDSFRIADAEPLRYRSMADSTDIAVRLTTVTLDGAGSPTYRLDVDGGAELPFLQEFDLANLEFGLNGSFDWKPSAPYAVRAEDVEIRVDDYRATMSLAADFSGKPMLTEFDGKIVNLPVEQLLRHVPASMRDAAKPLKTDMRIEASFRLAKPWALTDSLLPTGHAALSIPRCSASYQTITMQELSAELQADIDGADLDRSTVNLESLRIRGEGVTVDLRCSVASPLSDPAIEGRFKGSVNLSQIPPRLASELPVELKGVIDGEADFRLRQSDLNAKNFHRVFADGGISFHRLTATAPGMGNAYLGEGRIEFGTTDSFLRDGHKVDSLLQVSLKIDTLSATGMGINLEVKDFRAGAGTVNRRSSADTTEINPFGGSIAAGLVRFDAPADTMRARLRDVSIGGALRRYKGNGRSPLIDLRLDAGRMMMGQGLNRVALTDTDLDLTVNMRQREHNRARAAESPAEREMRRALRQQADSAAAALAAANGDVDIRLDREDRRLLRRWDFKGSLRAKRGRLVTPYFPLRNRLSNIDLRFNSDSIQLSDLLYKAGESDFLINGTISNLRGALTSRRNNTLGIEFDVLSDTINVNQIVKALYAGPSIAARTDSADVWGTDDDAAQTGHFAEMADTAAAGPVLIPHNIDGHFRMRANHILYSDLRLHSFKGDVLMLDGAVNLRNLSASTDIGSLSINGLYSSANPDSLQFGLGMKVDRFRIDRLTSLVPAIDSLLPAMKDFAGVVNADIAVATDLERNMDINIPSLKAAIKIEGDSLVLLDPDTFRTISKWLLFKNKKRNMIDHLAVEVIIDNSTIELYPFMFDIDRYRLGVMGHNDLAMNMNYHVSVLKSPIPFKFGINIKGTPDKMKIRLGGAKFKENMIGERQVIADNTRINLVKQIDNVFRSGVRKARKGRINFEPRSGAGTGAGAEAMKALDAEFDNQDRLEYADSLKMIRAGLIENPDTLRFPPHDPPAPSLQKAGKSKTSKGKKK